jgi:hypothetical protein
MNGGLFPGRTTAKVICKLLNHYQYLRYTGVTRGHTSSQQVEKNEIVAVFLLCSSPHEWEARLGAMSPPCCLPGICRMLKQKNDPTNCHEGNTQGLEVKVRVAERRPIDPRCTSTYRQTWLNSAVPLCLPPIVGCHVRRSLLYWLSFGVGRPKCPFCTLIFRRVRKTARSDS